MHETNANLSKTHPHLPRRNYHHRCNSSTVDWRARLDLRNSQSDPQVLLDSIDRRSVGASDEACDLFSPLLAE